MHPREKVLQTARLLQSRGEPIPLDVLAEADRLGLIIGVGDMPEGENQHGYETKHRQIPQGRLSIPKGPRKVPPPE